MNSLLHVCFLLKEFLFSTPSTPTVVVSFLHGSRLRKKHSPEKTKTHLEGEYPYLWDLLAMLITHLQVLGWSCKYSPLTGQSWWFVVKLWKSQWLSRKGKRQRSEPVRKPNRWNFAIWHLCHLYILGGGNSNICLMFTARKLGVAFPPFLSTASFPASIASGKLQIPGLETQVFNG